MNQNFNDTVNDLIMPLLDLAPMRVIETIYQTRNPKNYAPLLGCNNSRVPF